MKKTLKIFGLLFMMVAMLPMASCGDDNDEPDTNYAAAIAGTYTGKLESGGTLISDTYVVYVSRIADQMVVFTAPFLADGSDNFNVSMNNGVYTLSSADHTNISITISGSNMTVSFLNQAGTQTTFSGVKSR